MVDVGTSIDRLCARWPDRVRALQTFGEWVWTGQKSPPLHCAKCVWAQGGVGTPVPKETPEVSPVTASKAGSWPCAYLWFNANSASRSLPQQFQQSFHVRWCCLCLQGLLMAMCYLDAAWLCKSKLWPCGSMCIMSGLPSPHGKKNWRHTMQPLENSPEDREQNHQKPDAILQKWSNMWKTCTAAVPLSLVQNVPAQLPPRKKGVISSSTLSELMTWFVEHVLRFRTNESVQWIAMAFYHSCFPVCKKAQIHHIMKEVMVRPVRHDVFWILLQGPYQDNAPILPWIRRQPAGSEKGSAISHVLSHSGPRLYSTLRTQKTFNDTMRNWDTMGYCEIGGIVQLDQVS